MSKQKKEDLLIERDLIKYVFGGASEKESNLEDVAPLDVVDMLERTSVVGDVSVENIDSLGLSDVAQIMAEPGTLQIDEDTGLFGCSNEYYPDKLLWKKFNY